MMKNVKLFSCFVFLFSFTSHIKASDNTISDEAVVTAESVMEFAEHMQPADQPLLEEKINQLSAKEKRRLLDLSMAQVKQAHELGEDVPMGVIYVLAVLIPPLAVGLYTDWDTPTLWNLLFTLIGWIPGVVHAFIVITR